jgi:hypothetical protein
MQNKPYWPLVVLTGRQQKRYDECWGAALEQAGGINKLSTLLSAYTGEYISHQAIRNWRRCTPQIPPHWALVIEDYTDGQANFFDLCPWMLPRAVRYNLMIEDQKKAS